MSCDSCPSCVMSFTMRLGFSISNLNTKSKKNEVQNYQQIVMSPGRKSILATAEDWLGGSFGFEGK